MVVAVVGVVQEIDVAGLDPALERIAHRLHGPRDRAHVDRHVLGLRDEPCPRITERRGEVSARVQDLRVGRAQHRLAHLLHDGLEPMRQDRHRHWIAHGLKIYAIVRSWSTLPGARRLRDLPRGFVPDA